MQIIAVGYRVKSKEDTDFRIWATKTLKEYISDFDELLMQSKDIKNNEN